MSYESDLLVWLPHLTRYARALTGERAWADDLVQDTLERALNRPPRDGGNLRAWLLTLLRHRFIDQLRARHEIAVDDATAPWQTMAAPAGEVGGLELRDVQRALYRLPVEQREVLLLVALEELSYRDAAQVLGVPVGTVMSRLARARADARIAVGCAAGARHGDVTGDREAMMDDPRKPSNRRDDDASAQLLSALLDGELSGRERREMLERLQSDPGEAERFAHYRAQRDALKALFPLPAAAPALFVQRRAPRWRAVAHAFAGLAAGLLIGVALHAGWSAFGSEPAFAARADVAYAVYAAEREHPVEVDATDPARLAAWLSARVGRPRSSCTSARTARA